MKAKALLICVCAFVINARAYGPDGHDIVGGIADRRLSNTPTAAKIAALIDGIPLWRDDLHRAGWRLAALLERALANAGPTSAASSALPSVTPNGSAVPSATPVASGTPTSPAPARSATPVPSVVSDPVYGEYPTRYKGLINDWLYQHLYDPLSAKIEWLSEPKRGDLPDARGRKVYGYLVLFSVNSRNRFGAYTGKQTHGALIRNGTIVQTSGFVYEKR